MFDRHRFGRLAAATWSENRRTWGWFFLVGILIHILLLGVFLFVDDGYAAFGFDGQSFVWFSGLFLLAPVFAARYFQAMARRESALVLLMRPASAFEKWLLAVVVIVLLYPLAYVLAFQVAGLPAYLYGLVAAGAQHADMVADLSPSRRVELDAEFAKDWRYFLPWRAESEWRAMLPMLLALQGFAVLGSLYFRSVPFIKTLVAGFAVLLVLTLATAVLGGEPGLFLGYWSREARLAPWQAVVLPAAWFGVPALLWAACLVALREKEVA